jgi:hypothetical protein
MTPPSIGRPLPATVPILSIRSSIPTVTAMDWLQVICRRSGTVKDTTTRNHANDHARWWWGRRPFRRRRVNPPRYILRASAPTGSSPVSDIICPRKLPKHSLPPWRNSPAFDPPRRRENRAKQVLGQCRKPSVVALAEYAAVDLALSIFKVDMRTSFVQIRFFPNLCIIVI